LLFSTKPLGKLAQLVAENMLAAIACLRRAFLREDQAIRIGDGLDVDRRAEGLELSSRRMRSRVPMRTM
jgi:hypothetical protein